MLGTGIDVGTGAGGSKDMAAYAAVPAGQHPPAGTAHSQNSQSQRVEDVRWLCRMMMQVFRWDFIAATGSDMAMEMSWQAWLLTTAE